VPGTLRLIAFDLRLVAVRCRLLYSVSAGDQESLPGAFDVLPVVLLVSALLAVRFLRGRGVFRRLGRWQANYVPSTPCGRRAW